LHGNFVAKQMQHLDEIVFEIFRKLFTFYEHPVADISNALSLPTEMVPKIRWIFED